MEAPKKIYLTEDNPTKEWYRTKQVGFDSIEYTRTDVVVKKACRCYCDDICHVGMAGMCFHKHDGQGQIKNTFKYNECNNLKLLISAMEKE